MAQTLHQLLERAADVGPERPAVVDGDRVVSYGELEGSANGLANTLAGLGVGPGQRVCLYLEKSASAVVALYGVMKTGACYVPIDPGSPAPRAAMIVRDCGAEVLITSTGMAKRWPELLAEGIAGARLVVIDGDPPAPDAGVPALGAEDLGRAPTARPTVAVERDDLAYILYTSGSTGRPKGVQLTHGNALAFVEWAAREFAFTAEDRFSSHAPLHFDLSVLDLFGAALAGATVVLVPARLSVFPIQIRDFIEAHAITVWYSVPSVLSALTLRGGLSAASLPSLRCLLFAGEVFPTPYLRQLRELLTRPRFANLYGPTETNVCTWYEVDQAPEGDGTIPIGRAIDGVETFVVDDRGDLVPDGTVGELLVNGPTVMRGYWGDPQRTASVLVPDPRRPASGELAYRTGDLVQLLPSGHYAFLGRRDSQIKSRGYRIELGEVESVVHAHPGVRECAALAVPDPVFTNRLCVVVSLHEGSSEDEVRRHCAGRLPRYMVPELWRVLDALPRTSTGKIDRRVLQDQAEDLYEVH